jgi:C-terminal processing protease CtpA/Prc
VLRIAQFGENQYAAACTAVFTPGIGQRALQLQVRSRQQTVLREALAALRKAGARRLLIDITGNGGGSEWVSEVTALMSANEMSREQTRLAGPACDRRGVWRGESACTVFAAGGERATLRGVGAWNGPVLILADRNTASASEDLVAWLQQNRVARVIGERTLGAGCGYMGGGGRTQLRASHFDVRMPNCARYLDDGSNEIDGLAPDIAIDMRVKDKTAQARLLQAELAKL